MPLPTRKTVSATAARATTGTKRITVPPTVRVSRQKASCLPPTLTITDLCCGSRSMIRTGYRYLMCTTTRMPASTAAPPRRDGPLPWVSSPLSQIIIWPAGGCSSWRTSDVLRTRSTRTGGRPRPTCSFALWDVRTRFCPARTLLQPGSGTCWTGPLRPAKGPRRADRSLERDRPTAPRDRQAVVVADRGGASCDTSNEPRGSPVERAGGRVLGEPHGIGLVIFRYVAERAIAWLHGFPPPAHPLGET